MHFFCRAELYSKKGDLTQAIFNYSQVSIDNLIYSQHTKESCTPKYLQVLPQTLIHFSCFHSLTYFIAHPPLISFIYILIHFQTYLLANCLAYTCSLTYVFRSSAHSQTRLLMLMHLQTHSRTDSLTQTCSLQLRAFLNIC